MIEKIKKELENINTRKDKIKFLINKIQETKNKKLIIQLEEILNQVIQEESLEERIELPQQQIDIPKRDLEKRESLQERVPQETKKQDFFERVDYSRAINYNSERERLLKGLSVDPTRRETIQNLNLTTSEIKDYFGSKSQEYLRRTPDNVKKVEVNEIEKPTFEIPEMLKRKKLNTQDVKYEIT
ncbi:hypothetical protein J4438_03950 [Candidatus Woesearchaeota archaeon]|nr:hypothetical protein [Candidatus Woesearchaeota archaeon]